MDVEKLIKNANSIKEIVGDGCDAICNAADELISCVTTVARGYEKVDYIDTSGLHRSYYYYDFVKNTVCKFSYDGIMKRLYGLRNYRKELKKALESNDNINP